MVVTDKLYLIKIKDTDQNNKLISYSFCYDANEVGSFLTAQAGQSVSTYSYIRIPKEEHISVEDFINLTGYDVSIETYKAFGYDNKIYFVKIYILVEINGKIETIHYIDKYDCVYNAEFATSSAFVRELSNLYNHYLTDEKINDIIKNNILDYDISVLVFHGNRIKFDTADEIKEYYINNIFNVEKEKIYDFLLSMIRYDERHFTPNGDFITSRNKHQLLGDNDYGYIVLPLFSMETAEDLYINKDELI